jgi:UDP-3-O-[3-hydroxymyristoyl] glucosamine N-acyltransferase
MRTAKDMLSAQHIRQHHADLCAFVGGNAQAVACGCSSPGGANADSLVFVSDRAQLGSLQGHGAAIVVAHHSLSDVIASRPDPGTCYFATDSIGPAMAVLLTYFDRKADRFAQWGERHATAVVHERAHIGANVHLGPFCVIGSGARIGDHCLIGAHTVVENDALIGERTVLHPHVFVGSGCTVGADCEIHPHTCIGSDGFGYVRGPNGLPMKIPHLGNVQIDDHVEIGGNCSIDRAKLDSTHIRSGAKLDNICHIAHNCDLGENGFYTAGFMMAGSTKIGRNFSTGGNSVVSSHLTIADHVSLAGRSTVTNDISEPGEYGGYPLQPLRQALKTIATLGGLTEMRKNLARVMRRLEPAASGDDPRDPHALAADRSRSHKDE